MSTVEVTDLTGPEIIRYAAGATRNDHGTPALVDRETMYRSEHSPIRARTWWIRLQGVPAYVSVHLVRHKHGVEHYVRTSREDIQGIDPREVNRLTPVSHTMVANDQALIAMSRKRLCWNADRRTVAEWRRVCRAVAEQDEALGRWLVPECAYRGGWCPEPRACHVGPDVAVSVYGMPGRGIGPMSTGRWSKRARRVADQIWNSIYRATEAKR